MDNTMINTVAVPKNIDRARAEELHTKIAVGLNLMGQALYDICKNLKEMRDGEYYKAFGYDSFEDYTLKEFNIGKRQAYNYIQPLEQLGDEFLKSNSSLGITKLQLLASVPVFDREELTEENDLGGMTVKQVKELIEQNNRQAEQISLFQEKTEKSAGTLEQAEQKIKMLTKQLEEVKKQKPDEKLIKQIKDKEKSDYDKLLEYDRKKHEEQIKEYESRLEEAEKQSDQYIQRLLSSEKEIEGLKEKLSGKTAPVNTDTAAVRFKVYFSSIQDNINGLFDCIDKISDKDIAVKCTAAIGSLVGAINTKLESVNN